uniref:riboflavin kinase n=1 Tax=Plectus sambesii TaxID=2011161 RepID=A0A914V2S8_9BILA
MGAKRGPGAMLPYFASGRVVTGFGRGGKQLGCPTANLEDATVSDLPVDFDCGVYYGFASVDGGPLNGMVMSIGWNPQFKNTRKSMEVHILRSFDDDFYGSFLKIVITGFVRPMTSFSSLDELVKAIDEDIRIAREKLTTDDLNKYAAHEFFNTSIPSGSQPPQHHDVNGKL